MLCWMWFLFLYEIWNEINYNSLFKNDKTITFTAQLIGKQIIFFISLFYFVMIKRLCMKMSHFYGYSCCKHNSILSVLFLVLFVRKSHTIQCVKMKWPQRNKFHSKERFKITHILPPKWFQCVWTLNKNNNIIQTRKWNKTKFVYILNIK